MLSKDARETIFLDAEWESALDMETARAVLREFLLGCLPVDVQGDVRFSYWEDSGAPGATADVGDPAGWMGVERMRRITFLLAKALREGQHI
jgi:hypothetical protein